MCLEDTPGLKEVLGESGNRKCRPPTCVIFRMLFGKKEGGADFATAFAPWKKLEASEKYRGQETKA